MAIKVPTAFIFFDSRHELKTQTGKYALKLNVHYMGVKKRYNLPYHLTKDEWQKINSQKLKDTDLKDIKTKLDFLTGKKFEDSLKQIDEPFTFSKFEDIFFEKNLPVQKNMDVYSLYQTYIDKLKQDGRVGNAQIYSTAMKTFQEQRKKLNFNDVDVEFLQSYEKEMLSKGKSVAYISMNIRTLRSIYYQAISLGFINSVNYPFSQKANDKKYKIKKGNNTKKALNTEQLSILKNYIVKTPAQQKALDFWFFSFYSNGLNFKDICRLQYKNIIGNKIVLIRAKTERSTNSSETIQFIIIPEIQAIIDQYANPIVSTETYVFDILKQGITPQKERDKIQSLTRNTNKHLKNICNDLNFGFSITTGWARHSFATFLKRSGSTIEVIGEALGHTNVITTRNYLSSFDDGALQNTANLLSQI